MNIDGNGNNPYSHWKKIPMDFLLLQTCIRLYTNPASPVISSAHRSLGTVNVSLNVSHWEPKRTRSRFENTVN